VTIYQKFLNIHDFVHFIRCSTAASCQLYIVWRINEYWINGIVSKMFWRLAN